MRTRYAPALLVVPIALAGCTLHHGDRLEDFPPATGPAGIRGTFVVLGTDRALEGELLAVGETGILLVSDGAVHRLAYSVVERAHFRDRPGLGFQGGPLDRTWSPDREVRTSLRGLARYPRGVDAELLERLLRAHGQERLPENGTPEGSDGAREVPVGARMTPDVHRTIGRSSVLVRAHPDSVTALLAVVRAATHRFHDRSLAIREGYRRLGPDFPGMGEHWIHPAVAVEGRIDLSDPPVLTYVEVDGRPVLTGVAYTLPVGTGEMPPPFLGLAEVWHDHSGGVDEESLLLNHRVRDHTHADHPPRARLAMVHVWAWSGNPAGVLAQHNWTLPFLRAGLPPVAGAPAPAARALSLAGDGTGYYADLLEAAAGADAARACEGVLRTHGARVDAWVAGVRSARDAQAGDRLDLAPLVEVWDGLWRTLEEECLPSPVPVLSALRADLEG